MSGVRTRETLVAIVRSPRGVFAAAVLAVVVLCALVSFAWLPGDPYTANIGDAWLPPSPAHWLGTDGSGRDIAARLMLGSRITVLVACGTGLLAGAVGIGLAVASALSPRWLREPLAVLIDVLIAFPTLLLAIMLASAVGGGISVVVVAVGISYGVAVARVVRAELRQVLAADYVLAARAVGLSRARILRAHLLPGVAPVLVVQVSLSMGLAILAESGLSYLGFGAPPGMPSWGRILAETQRFVTLHPEVVIWPGLAITLTVLAFTVLGDVFREALDPTLRRGERRRRATAGVQSEEAS